jgi:CDP-diacylglycerol--glycerol-3-phosphate 3-phosphatidyltransferase
MVLLFYALKPFGGLYAAGVFVLASFSDILDGAIARKQNLISDFGKVFDPLADKLLAVAALILLVEADGLSYVTGGIAVIIIISRELLIGTVRQLAAKEGKLIAANKWGKIKTLFLTVSVFILLCTTVDLYSAFSLSVEAQQALYTVGMILFYVATFLSLLSIIIYIVDNLELLRGGGKTKNE